MLRINETHAEWHLSRMGNAYYEPRIDGPSLVWPTHGVRLDLLSLNRFHHILSEKMTKSEIMIIYDDYW